MPKHRRQYYGEWLKLARLTWPIWLTQLTHILLGVVETAMNGSFATTHLAALALGTGVWLPVHLFVMGVMMAASPLVGKHMGADQPQQAAQISIQGLYLAVVTSLLGGLLVWLGYQVIGALNAPAILIDLAQQYLFISALGLLPLTVAFNLRFCFEGTGYTKAALICEAFALTTSVLCNYALVFGKWGLPALGVVGSGWANVAISLAFLFGFAIVGTVLPPLKPYGWLRGNYRPQWQRIKHWLAIGLPIGLGLCAEGSLFSAVAIIVASLGEIQVAAHQVALNYTTLTYMLPFSLSMAITIRTSQAFGKNQARLTRQTITTFSAFALAPGLVNTLVMAVGLLWVIPLYTDDPQVIAYAKLLFFAALLYQIPDAVQSCFLGILRGLHDTLIAMLISITCYWLIGLPLGYWLAFNQGFETLGMWYAMIVALSLSALLLGWRVKALWGRL